MLCNNKNNMAFLVAAAARRGKERERRANEKRRKEQKRSAYRDEVATDVESGGNPFLAAHESAAVRHDPLDELGSRRRVGGGFP